MNDKMIGKNAKLTDLLSFIVDNRGKTVPISNDGMPLIATNCIKNTELFPVYEKVRYVSNDTYKNWFRSHPQPGDIIFVNKGTPGRVCMVPDPVDFCIAQDMMALRVNEHLVYNKYLFAVLRSADMQSMISNLHVGTMIPHVKKSDLDKVVIPLPNYCIQEYIGDFYFRISEKIELNNKINKTLEEIAQAIFKSWFVDYEPFKDCTFTNSKVGKIPAEWQLSRIGDLSITVTDFVANGSFASLKENVQLYESENYAYFIRNVDLKANVFRKFVDKESYEFLSKSSLEGGEVIISNVGDVGSVYLCPKLDKPMTLGNNIIVIKSKNKEINYNLFIYLLFKYNYGADLLANITSGSAQPKFNKTDFKNLQIVIPDIKTLNRFNELVSDLIKQQNNYKKEISILTKIKDSLLPKLMSGEIRVPLEEVPNAEVR